MSVVRGYTYPPDVGRIMICSGASLATLKKIRELRYMEPRAVDIEQLAWSWSVEPGLEELLVTRTHSSGEEIEFRSPE
jgi:hypothetical protein